MLNKSVFGWLHALISGYWFSAAHGGGVGGAWVRHAYCRTNLWDTDTDTFI